jgi:hypothetical protein
MIAFDAMPSFYDQLRAVGKHESIDLWIHSHGGATEVPWRIVQMIRCYCSAFGVLVTEIAQSAATHIALGADEIVMGPFSLLSPVDPQRQHPLLPKGVDPADPEGKERTIPISVQDLKHAVEFIKREAGDAGLTGEAYAQVISALFDKVYPLALGAIEQSYALSKLITRRMLATHMDETEDADKIDSIVDALSDDYKSHQFPIGLPEARRLELKVVEAPDELYEAMWALLNYYRGLDRVPKPLPAGATVSGPRFQGTPMMQPVGHLDSTAQRTDCVGIADVSKDGVAVGRGSVWMRLPPTP